MKLCRSVAVLAVIGVTPQTWADTTQANHAEQEEWVPVEETAHSIPQPQPLPASATWLDWQNRVDRDDHSEQQTSQLHITAPINERWGLDSEYLYLNKSRRQTMGPPKGTNQLMRVQASYRHQDLEWQWGGHYGEGYQNYSGWDLGLRWHLQRALIWSWQATYHDASRETPELQLFSTRDRISSQVFWHSARSRARLDAAGNRYQRQDTEQRLAQGAEVNAEWAYQLFDAYPQLSMALTLRWADYSQEAQASLPASAFAAPPAPPPPPAPPIGQPPQGMQPPPPPPPAPPAPAMPYFAPKDAREVGIVWTYGLSDDRLLPVAWQPIMRAGISMNKGDFGYQYLFGLEGPIFGHDRLRLAYGERKNSESAQQSATQNGNNSNNNGQALQQLELRYQHAF